MKTIEIINYRVFNTPMMKTINGSLENGYHFLFAVIAISITHSKLW